jgi:hypothetical protein
MPITRIFDESTQTSRDLTPEEISLYNKSPDDIRAGVPQTDQEVIDESINNLSTNDSGMATSTDLSQGYLQSLVSEGLISPQEQIEETKRVGKVQKGILVEQQENIMENLLRPYDVMIGETRKNLELNLSRANAILTRGASDLGLDTANQSTLSNITQAGEANIEKIKVAREQARHNMRTEQLTELSLMLEHQETAINSIIDKANKQRLDLYNIKNEQAQQARLMLQTSFDIANKLPAGEIYTDQLTGISIMGIQQPDPLFSSQELISLMKEIPFGETQNITVFNPMSRQNETYQLTGLMKKDLNTQYYQSVDSGGNIHFLKLDKNTDEVTEIAVAQGAGKGTTYAPPTSYQEFQYAGGEKGTGMTYAEFLKSGAIKAPTSSQYQVATYADRIKSAEQVFTTLENYVAGLNVFEFKLQKGLPNMLQSANFQQFDQAKRNFVNAVLRRESGAAIAQSEFESAEKQYFAQPGDSKEVLAQKKTNRQQVLNGFIREAGSALGTTGEQTTDLRQVAIDAGYDYDQMRNDGYSDEEIKQAMGL